jgi:hypothetical protein
MGFASCSGIAPQIKQLVAARRKCVTRKAKNFRDEAQSVVGKPIQQGSPAKSGRSYSVEGDEA